MVDVRSILVLSQVREVRQEVQSLRKRGKTIALVPTMGFLHEGHLSLVRLAKEHADEVFVSIFVNPRQFTDSKDFESYPTDLKTDIALLRDEGAYAVFTPTVEELYPPGFQTSIGTGQLSKEFEGRFRPGHFEGVATVVTLLFTSVTPDVAIFGEKDFQQVRVVEQLVSDLRLPLTIVRGPLIRDYDGLALSSRNVRLSPTARELAVSIPNGLNAVLTAFQQGTVSVDALKDRFLAAIPRHPLVSVEYAEIADEATLSAREGDARSGDRVLVVVKVDGVRLLDNLRLV